MQTPSMESMTDVLAHSSLPRDVKEAIVTECRRDFTINQYVSDVKFVPVDSDVNLDDLLNGIITQDDLNTIESKLGWVITNTQSEIEAFEQAYVNLLQKIRGVHHARASLLIELNPALRAIVSYKSRQRVANGAKRQSITKADFTELKEYTVKRVTSKK